MRRSVLALLSTLVTLLSACTATVPHSMLPSENHPLADSAVLLAHTDMIPYEPTPVFASVMSVDGKSTGCRNEHVPASTVCPFWVRVEPGSHVFRLRYMRIIGGDITVSKMRLAEVPLPIPDMKPRHTYRVRFLEQGGQIAAEYVDLGPDSTDGPRICAYGGIWSTRCDTRYPAKF